MIDFDHIDPESLLSQKLDETVSQLKTFAKAARVFRDPFELYRLTYQQASASFPVRRDEIDAKRPGRLPLAARDVALRLAALKARHEEDFGRKNLSEEIRDVHFALTNDFLGDAAGTFRTTQIRLAPSNADALTEYQPPSPERIAASTERMSFAVAKASEVHPMAAIIICYAGMILLHPFTDGNGRVSRICVERNLKSARFLREPCLCIEGAFRRHDRANGFWLTRLEASGDWAEFAEFFLEILLMAIQDAEAVVKAKITQSFSRFE